MANAFNKGDVVVMKSGGPPMTVDEVPDDVGRNRTYYRCCWFKGAVAQSGNYSEHLLEKYVAPAKK
ncbi:YodC family protein [Azospirillum aestuarii]|uniref:YodC family protein n=1 Tax=Azospirillum aestuarii TaxID=2802052 RepID=UPI004054F0C2